MKKTGETGVDVSQFDPFTAYKASFLVIDLLKKHGYIPEEDEEKIYDLLLNDFLGDIPFSSCPINRK